ncbi:E3 ubiquitin-protein ligase RNF26 [Sminthopsis crassicaudata]|uniref:E3 ubiquitin-protein ligase RNF26 n=1 Tax=Sminthopsis crassicaudata TaxID=9301 RepID=UPI003D68435D
MEAVYLVLNGIGLALDVLGFVLDLNFLLVSSMLAALTWMVTFFYNLPHTVLAGLLHLGRGAVLSTLAILESLARLIVGALQAAGALLRGCCSGLESLKVAGHLALHVATRGRELLQRGLLTMAASSQALLRQACDVCAIAMSLVAYVVNSLVNICLIGTQNLFALGLALWDSVMGPLWRVTDVLAAFFAHVSSSAVAMAILLWTPCQLVLELVASGTRLLATFMLANLLGLVLLGVVLAVTVTILHPDLAVRLAVRAAEQLHALPSYHRLRGDVARLSRLALSSESWRRVRSRSLQLASWSIGGGGGGGGGGAPGAPGAPQGGPRRGPPVRNRGHEQPPEPAPRFLLRPDEEAGTSRGAPVRGRERLNEEEPLPGHDPWQLLKEQEERKKCVICQDQSKTVLLLPCRHLCLCQGCTEILLRQPAYQRNCPLCRQGILQTLNVYL